MFGIVYNGVLKQTFEGGLAAAQTFYFIEESITEALKVNIRFLEPMHYQLFRYGKDNIQLIDQFKVEV